MSDEPTYETCCFMITLEMPTTPDTPIDMEELATVIREALEGDPDFNAAKAIEVHPPQLCIRTLDPETLEDLTDETIEYIVDSIEKETGESPPSRSRDDMLFFLRQGMAEDEKVLH